MFIEIEYWNQDTRNLTYVNGCGYPTYYKDKAIINTDLVLSLPLQPSQDATGITGGDLYKIPYKDSRTYPIFTTFKTVRRLMKMLNVKKN